MFSSKVRIPFPYKKIVMILLSKAIHGSGLGSTETQLDSKEWQERRTYHQLRTSVGRIESVLPQVESVLVEIEREWRSRFC